MNTLSSLLNFIGNKIPSIGVVEVTQSGVSSLPVTITNTAISANHVVVESVLSNPLAQTGDWTVSTTTGALTISGAIDGTTDITLKLGTKVNQ